MWEVWGVGFFSLALVADLLVCFINKNGFPLLESVYLCKLQHFLLKNFSSFPIFLISSWRFSYEFPIRAGRPNGANVIMTNRWEILKGSKI